MAKTIQGASRTEYQILSNKGRMAHFSHEDKDVAAAKLASMKANDHANGVDIDYTKATRTVTYADLKEFPQGEDSRYAKGEESTVEGWE